MRGLAINSFSRGAAISVSQLTGQRGVLVQGNFIGTDASGQLALPNQTGILLSGSADILIGGARPEMRNVISANGAGILANAGGAMFNAYATSARVQGNFIGTDRSGTRPLGNGEGVACSSAQGLASVSLDIGGLQSGAETSSLVIPITPSNPSIALALVLPET